MDHQLSNSETGTSNPRSRCWWRRLMVGLLLFGAAFGYIEAAVVVYLRTIYEPLRMEMHSEHASGDLFPLLTLEDLEAAGGDHLHLLAVEVGREAATLFLLAGAGLLLAGNFYQWFAAFVIGFGWWDLFYYLWLKLLIDWPPGLLTWDILFLIPVTWVGPVLAPMLVAGTMVLTGGYLLWRETTAQPLRLNRLHWILVILGGAIIVLSFSFDADHVMAGGYPRRFYWPIFLCGLLLSLAAYLHAAIRSRTADSRR